MRYKAEIKKEYTRIYREICPKSADIKFILLSQEMNNNVSFTTILSEDLNINYMNNLGELLPLTYL